MFETKLRHVEGDDDCVGSGGILQCGEDSAKGALFEGIDDLVLEEFVAGRIEAGGDGDELGGAGPGEGLVEVLEDRAVVELEPSFG